MVFGPRDDDELETVVGIVTTSHAYAAGTLRDHAVPTTT
jgi:hypothetical protein